jgi:hypothetical protein
LLVMPLVFQPLKHGSGVLQTNNPFISALHLSGSHKIKDHKFLLTHWFVCICGGLTACETFCDLHTAFSVWVWAVSTAIRVSLAFVWTDIESLGRCLAILCTCQLCFITLSSIL